MRARMDARCVCKSVYTRECVSHVYESVYTTLCVEDYVCIYISMWVRMYCTCVCMYLYAYIHTHIYVHECMIV